MTLLPRHLVQVSDRKAEIDSLGAAVVVVAYDRPGLLGAKMMRGLDVPYTIVFDPGRKAYRAWGLGRTNLLGAMLSLLELEISQAPVEELRRAAGAPVGG